MSTRQPQAFPHDDLGRDLVITIRIGRDGRIYFQDIPMDMIPVARALCPGDPDLQLRERAAALLSTQTHERQG